MMDVSRGLDPADLEAFGAQRFLGELGASQLLPAPRANHDGRAGRVRRRGKVLPTARLEETRISSGMVCLFADAVRSVQSYH
jgi:hypothetical protein